MDLLEQAKQALAAAQDAVAQEKRRHRDALADHNGEIKRLRAAIRALEGQKGTTRSPAKMAGPGALSAVRKALNAGPLTQAQIVRRTKLNDGTVSYAVRALVDAGEIEATGVRVSGSREFRLRTESKVA